MQTQYVIKVRIQEISDQQQFNQETAAQADKVTIQSRTRSH
jgi:hypothetical protein